MKISIGILAHNEEAYIGATIASLLAQSVCADATIAKEIVVVANGCADRTASAAEAALQPAAALANCEIRIRNVDEAGKANAWNLFVHQESAADADYLVLLDADIDFASPDVIARLIGHLAANPAVDIAPDQPVKKFSGRGGVLQPVIRALQKSGGDDDHALSGQLYAARAGRIRAVSMPTGIVVEDGFLRAMILTRNFSESEATARILRAPGARHFYKPYETFGDIYRYERRQALGTAINRFLYDEFRRWRAAGVDVADEIRRRNDGERGWVEAIIEEGARQSGLIAIPRNYMLRRLRRRDNWTPKRALKAPLVLASVIYDLAIAIDASRQLRKRGGRWDTIRAAK